MTNKLCGTCGIEKKPKDFSRSKSTYDGLQARCKSCDKSRLQAYRKTASGLITHLYFRQKQSSKSRGHAPPEYTCEELKAWALYQDSFKCLFDAWVISGYDKNLTPSVDRLDDTRGYSLDRIQLVTWRENKLKGESDRRNGVSVRNHKAVLQFGIDGKFIAKHHSSGAAERAINGRRGSFTTICQCCRGVIKTAAGFKWRYA